MNNEDTRAITSVNRAAWNQVAPIHARHNQATLIENFKLPGFSCLDDIETRILNSLGVAGKDVAQVCCNNGRELLSVENMGAKNCVGFDGAQGFVDQARELACVGGLDAEFVCTDIYDIDAKFYRCFDLVTITIGVLAWMPDLEGFFKVVSKLLRPGGAVFFYEQHPILDMIEPAKTDAPIVWDTSYFTKQPFVGTGGLDYWTGKTYDAKLNTSFFHTMSDIIMAGIGNSLSVEHFEEFPHHISNSFWNVEASDIGLPMCYALILRKARMKGN